MATSGTVGTAAYQSIRETVPADVRTLLDDIDAESAYAWVARARCLAEQLAEREERCQVLEAEASKMKRSLLRSKAALQKAQGVDDTDDSSVLVRHAALRPSAADAAAARPQSVIRLLLV